MTGTLTAGFYRKLYALGRYPLPAPTPHRHMQIKILPNDTRQDESQPLASAELHFTDGPLQGMKLVGFTVWENKRKVRTVGFPARTYSVNNERRSFALLRDIDSDVGGSQRVRDMILAAYQEHIERTQK